MFLRPASRLYHSVSHPASNAIIRAKLPETALLTKAVSLIPQYGFTQRSIDAAVKEMGLSDAIQTVLTSSPKNYSPEAALTLFWLKYQRQKLHDMVMDPEAEFHKIRDEYDRAAYLLKTRLDFNKPVALHLKQALGQLVLPYNWPGSLEELHNLSDDIAFYAGDSSNDSAWYTKRLSFSTVYVKSELFMLQDSSPDFARTHRYVEDSIRNMKQAGDAYNAVEQWSVFNAISLWNLIRSQAARF